MKVAIVGSGPVGATWARLLLEGVRDIQVTMVERGPLVSAPPGANVRNIADPQAQADARRLSQGPAGAERMGLGIPSGSVVEGTVTARQGTYLVGDGRPGHMPAAAVASCVGGQGAHWTCSTPRPFGSERIPVIPEREWDDAIELAENLLHVRSDAFADDPASQAIRATLSTVFDEQLPPGRRVGILPVACDINDDGSVRWVGTDTILESVLHDDRFALRPNTLARRLRLAGPRVTGVEVEALDTGELAEIDADLVVVAADAIHTPQLLWASGIRPPALGRFLTEHPMVIGTVALREQAVRGIRVEATDSGDAVGAVSTVPFSESHPFKAQIMYLSRCPFPLAADDPAYENPFGYANVGWGCRKFPRSQDRVEFADADLDPYGLPRPQIHYALTDRELGEIEIARQLQRRAGQALGDFIGEGPRLLPEGSSLHYMGTTRIGGSDDGGSVCDQFSRVWGYTGLVVGGNSLIPTANAANPTLTSVAIAVHSARQLVNEISGP